MTGGRPAARELSRRAQPAGCTTAPGYRPVVLIVLDGWGRAERSAQGYDAIGQARTPNLARWEAQWPHTLLSASGEDVGLNPGQMGDSNVGHLNLGAGRIVYQDLVRIDRAVRDGTIGKAPAIRELFGSVACRGATLHLMGLLSDGGVHSHIGHLFALLDAAAGAGVKSVAVHAFLDGRDVPPRSARQYLEALDDRLRLIGRRLERAAEGPQPAYRLATLMGRYYAMDRDKRWERTGLAFRTMAARSKQWPPPPAGVKPWRRPTGAANPTNSSHRSGLPEPSRYAMVTGSSSSTSAPTGLGS